MIVQPDFCEHWKTRLLVEITGDESAPMAVLRLWAHCQHSRRCQFPDMTPPQLASICRWGSRKPACHAALVKAGFVEKLTPTGFMAHQWDEHNAQLLQKWRAGEKGGRPPLAENPNKTEDSGKPTGNRPITGTKPDQIRSDQTRSDRSERPDQTRPDGQPPSHAPGPSPPSPLEDSDRMDSKDQSFGSGGLDGLVATLAKKMTPRIGTPTREEVHQYLRLAFNGAEQYADPFYDAMEKQHWLDRNRKPLTNWQSMAKSYASKAYLSQGR